MIQYFQLTPEILLEYIYEDDPKLNEDDIKGNIKDIYDDYPTMLLKSEAFSSKYMCFKNESEGLGSISNLVLPLNNTDTQFVIAKTKHQNFFSLVNSSNRFLKNNGSGYIYEDTKYDKDITNSCDVKYDKCIIHFTSGNYFGNYDSLIFQAYAYMSNKSKLYFASFLFKKTSNLEMTPEQLLYNEKLYTTQIEFDIPSVFAIFTNDNDTFNKALESQNIELLENTPICINVYGVSGSTIGGDNYERLKTFKLNSISIPYIYNKLDEIHINIFEAKDGDYFNIEPKMNSNISFVDYIERMGEDIRSYMIMHEICLKESWVDKDGEPRSEITHKEYYIININEDDENEKISDEFNKEIKYRPICIKSGEGYVATIIDKIKIYNTVDSSSYEVVGSLNISNPSKYGKKLTRLFETVSRPIVNVYNKKVISGSNGYKTISASDSGNISDSNINSGSNLDTNGLIVVNKGVGGGFVVENITQNIVSFIECTNIGVSIVELSPDDIK